MTSEVYILWLGNVFKESVIRDNPAVSNSASIWQQGFISALQKAGIRVRILCRQPEAAWPKGRLRIKAERDLLPDEIAGQVVDYYNLPFIRSLHLKREYTKAIDALIKEERKPDFIITYNLEHQNVASGRHFQDKLAIPWVCIIADQEYRGDPYAASKSAAGRIFLSWKNYSDCPYSPKFHLDGGVDSINISPREGESNEEDNKRVIVYAGSFNRWCGLPLLLKAFRLVKERNVELRICGRGDDRGVKKLSDEDPRVNYLGFVPSERLDDIYRDADIFINPRSPHILDNNNNFPYKLLSYLSYGKPIISTWTKGLDPHYRDILVTLERETPEGLADKIEEVLKWDSEKRSAVASRIRNYMEARKLWTVQIAELIEWLKKVR